MAPTADMDQRLISLQIAVAEARTKHEDLVKWHNLLDKLSYRASATHVRVKRDRALQEWKDASKRLADYISKRQRGLKR